MPEDWLSVAEAAERLGISRRRLQAYIDDGVLQSRMVGAVRLVSTAAMDHLQRTRSTAPGAPLTPDGAWRRIATVASNEQPLTRAALDAFRRAVRTRARHLRLYAHPATLSTARGWPRAVSGGREAAIAAGAAVDPVDDVMELYLPSSEEQRLIEAIRGRVIDDASERANLLLHVINDEVWPFSPTAIVVPGWVSWLDLADADDRAADTVLDRLVGGRIVS